MVQVKAKYTNVPVQTDVGEANKRKTRKRENSQKPPTHRKTRQTQPNKNQATPTKQTKATKEGEPKTPTRTTDNEAGRQDQTKRGRGGGEGKRRPANKERADAREGSRGRRENAAQAKVGAYSFSGVLRGFWITRGRIPQCRSEGHMNNTHSMVERAKPHTGPKPLLP